MVQDTQILVKEAEDQMKALKQLGKWRTGSIGISAIGVTIAYAGLIEMHYLWLGIAGIILLVGGFLFASVLNLGIRNGTQNVNKILNIIEGKERHASV